MREFSTVRVRVGTGIWCGSILEDLLIEVIALQDFL